MASRTLTVHRVLALVSTVLALTFITSLLGFVLFGIVLALTGLNLVFSQTYEKRLPSNRHLKHVKHLRTEVRVNKPRVIGGTIIAGAFFGLMLFGLRSLLVSLF